MWLRSTCILILACFVQAAVATHIIGGEMYYDHLGGSQYFVTLELYRDCGPDNTQGTGFDLEARIGVFDSGGTLLFTTPLSFPGEEQVPWTVDNPCLSAPPQICVTTTSYTGTFNLPPIPGGYTLAYQRCCRTPTIVNLMAPNEQGVTCTVHIPGPPDATNSSPRFTEDPPLVLCLNEDMVIDHSATDPDGDQLQYELCAPFHGGSNFDPAPLDPSTPPYTPVVWAAGYSDASPLDSDPPIAIDANTGIITVSPSLIGSFSFGVKVSEFRNGVLLSEVIRDFKFEVVSCETTIISVVADQDPQDLCNGLTVQFNNSSVNGQFWAWDFGDPTTTADTSEEDEPQWTYAQGGTYTVMLIANPGWPCADTSYADFSVMAPFDPYFDQPQILCPGEEVSLEAQGVLPPNANFIWEVPPNADAGALDEQVLTFALDEVGTHPVTLTVFVGNCEETFTDSVTVMPFPVADLTSDSNACVGELFGFQDLSTASTPMSYMWDFGDGATSTLPDPVHEYEAPGSYTVSLTVSTDSGCIAEHTVVRVGQVNVYPLPTAGFRVMPNTVSMIDAEVEVLDHAVDAVDWIYYLEGQTMYDPSFTYWFDGAGQVTVWQTVISADGCRDSTSVDVFITDHLFYAPNTFTPNGDGLNDTFAPVVKGARHYELVIYDRYGVELFRSRDPKAQWTGEELPEGVYTYTAHIAEFGTHRQLYKGHVTLLR